MRKSLSRILFVILLALLLVPGALQSRAMAQGRPTLVLACDIPPANLLMKRVEAYYSYLFNLVGYGVEFSYFPAGRGVLEGQSSSLDGDYFRIAEYGEIAKDMLMVKEPMATFRLGIYAVSKDFAALDSLDELMKWEGRPLVIGYTRGSIVQEMLIDRSGLKQHHRIYSVDSPDTGLNMLLEDRLDLFFGVPLMVEASQPFRSSKRIKLSGILFERYGYLWLNRRHAALVPQLEEEIRKSKEDGSMQRILWPDDSELPLD